MSRPLRADIDLDALRHNYQLACELAPNSRSLAVIKADAYGHGAVACARALADLAPAFAVATIEEALALREGGITHPVVLLEGVFEASEYQLAAQHDFWCAIHSEWQLAALEAATLPGPISCWIKFDSGMHRLGFDAEQARAVKERLVASGKAQDLHLMTHFATADSLTPDYFQHQMAAVEALAAELALPLCLANSPATLAWPQSHAAWNRPGIMLYGADPLEGANDASRRLKPVMTLSSAIIAVREIAIGEPVGYAGRFVATRPTRIGVVACGYGDGYDRHAVDGTPVLVDGQETVLAGKVSMDMLTVDITDLPEAGVGSRVVLWGEGLEVNRVAASCDTISYTLLTGILPRVPKHYHGSQAREADPMASQAVDTCA
ncbi:MULTISPECIES: alanine racemase [Cobetia]|uniref:alanine racemase n=1 Tax=Cobetia TaxID=204286 RepID=UPI00086679B7|nr:MULTISPECIES: alanine racemase [Cobetia]AOM00639.1 alanine racemase [Cobetia marina]AZV30729.1 alanine racemase [Cobetia sp. ICG0124]